MSELTDTQGQMDALEQKIIANKNNRMELREEAKTMRDEYIKLQEVREALLIKENQTEEGDN